MNEQQPHSIWGLNFLQDMKGEPSEITGAYDSKQQLWITQGQVQGGLIPEGLSGGFSSKLDNLPVRNQRNMGTRTQDSIDILPRLKDGGFLGSLRGFPASSRLAWLGFHRTRSYSLSTGIDG